MEEIKKYLEVYHCLSMAEKYTVREMIKNCNDHCSIVNNNPISKTIKGLFKPENIEEVVEERDDTICTRLSRFWEIWNEIKEGIKDEQARRSIISIIDSNVCDFGDLTECMVKIMSLYNDYCEKHKKDPVTLDFIMTDLIPFKLSDYCVYARNIRKHSTYIDSIYTIIQLYPEESRVFIIKVFENFFSPYITEEQMSSFNNAFCNFYDIKTFKIPDGFKVIGDSEKEQIKWYRSLFVQEPLRTDVPVKNEVEQESISHIKIPGEKVFQSYVSQVLKTDKKAEISFDLDESELCYIMKEIAEDNGVSAYYTTDEDGKRKFVRFAKYKDSEFILFKILNTSRDVIFGLSTDEKHLFSLVVDKEKYYFVEEF